MIILIINFLLCTLYALIIYPLHIRKKVKTKLFFIITICQLTALHGLVDPDVFPDLPGYCDTFKRISSYGFNSIGDEGKLFTSMEIGFQIWIWIVSIFTSDTQLFLLINSALFLFCFYKVFYNLSPYFWFSILLLLLVNFNQSVFVLRQHLSLAILFLSYPYIISRDLKSFLLILFISYLIHKSSLIFFPVYFLYGIKNSKIYLLSMTACGIFSFLLIPYISKIGSLFTRNEHFIENVSIGVATKALIMGCVMLIYLLILKNNAIKIGLNKLVFTISAVGIFGNALAGEAGEGRIFWSYYLVVLIQIPIILSYIHNMFAKSFFVLTVLSIYFAWAFFFAGDVVYWLNFSLII